MAMKYYGKVLKLVLLSLIILGFQISCEVRQTPISQATHTLSDPPKLTITPTTTPPVPSSTPAPVYQLTYISSCEYKLDCIFAIEVHGLDSQHLSFGTPQRLFTIPKTSESPKAPIFLSEWSPNGQKIAMEATGMKGQGDIFLGDETGVKWINLTNTPEYEGNPNWSADGQSVIFSGGTGDPNYFGLVFSTTLDGKNKKQMLGGVDPSITTIDDISLSPDGKRIVFTHSVNLYEQLYIADLDGSNLKQLSNREEDHFEPHFSPDGKWILYRREPKKGEMRSHLVMIRPDGSDEKQIPEEILGWKASFAWSPVGDWIAFMSGSESHYQIYLIHSDGTGLTKVSQSDIDASFPAWRVTIP